jgi:cytochrome c oxidase assembly factor CtaG/putative copper export protein
VLRLSRIAGPALLVLVAFAALLVALVVGGAAKPLPLADPGAVIRFGLPIATLCVDLGAALTIGALALTTFALTPDRPEWARALDIASAGAAFWTVASGVTGFFTFVSVSNVKVTLDAEFGQSLAFFLTNTGLGQAWLVSTLIAAAVTVLCFAVRNVTLVFFVALLAGVGLLPIAQQGHAAGTTSHVAAVTSLALHIIGAAVWLGGLLTIVLLRPLLERGRTGVVLSRYSTLALICFVIVAVSGVASAEIRIGSWAELGSPYGVLVLVKVVALILLGLFGVVHRRVLLAKIQKRAEATRASFWWFVSAELAFLGLASGVAAALSRTATPVSQKAVTDTAALTPAEVLTDSALPPEFTPLRWLTAFDFDLVWLLACAFLIVAYLIGVVRVRRRGDTWALGRTVRWCLGLVVLFVATNGAPNVYEKYVVSTHLVVIALAAFVVPALLASSAPWTLALLAIEKRSDGSRGPREWLMQIVRSAPAAWLTHPVTGAVLLAASLWGWIFSLPLLRWSVSTYAGHTVLVLQLVLVGWLFVQAVVGSDPVRLRAGGRVKAGLLVLVAVSTGVLGVVLATGRGLLLSNWFGAMGRLWGAAPVADQQLGGVVLAVVGVAVCAALAVALLVGARQEDAPVASTVAPKVKATRP